MWRLRGGRWLRLALAPDQFGQTPCQLLALRGRQVGPQAWPTGAGRGGLSLARQRRGWIQRAQLDVHLGFPLSQRVGGARYVLTVGEYAPRWVSGNWW